MLKIENLSFSYNGNAPYLLNDINLQINKGNYVSILGENGSGKSTLVKLILSLLKPCRGKIELDSKIIGYIPQKFDNMSHQFPLTVYEMLNCHRKALKLNNKEAIERSLNDVGMEDFKGNLIGDLSGGQQQKILIARALMGTPEILVMDEPSNGVDIQSQMEIYSTIKSLNNNRGITVIAVEHNLKAALENSDYIFRVDSGRGTLYRIDEFKKLTREGNIYAAV